MHSSHQEGIPFRIFERDGGIDTRQQGWAMTIHWALSALEDILPNKLVNKIDDVQVDPEQGRKDNGNFLFLDLSTGETKFRIPPNKRRRVGRDRFRKAMTEGLDVEWNKKISDVKTDGDKGVTAVFEDGTQATGRILVGVDGSNSTVRKFLRPDDYKNTQIPFRFTGASVKLTKEQVTPLRNVDPLLFQGAHPDTFNYMWFSMVDVPEVNGTEGDDTPIYTCQVNLSWPVKGPEDEVATTNEERVLNMRKRAADFVEPFKSAVDFIPLDAVVTEVKLADWPCLKWDNLGGKVTLASDAAHAMTMCKSPFCPKTSVVINDMLADLHNRQRRSSEPRPSRCRQAYFGAERHL
jgi:2-polyprenyl-6-methoxyphenol hydroxylase-like FAD-dependent oxidoreductase